VKLDLRYSGKSSSFEPGLAQQRTHFDAFVHRILRGVAANLPTLAHDQSSSNFLDYRCCRTGRHRC